jgi:hypothetical protein
MAGCLVAKAKVKGIEPGVPLHHARVGESVSVRTVPGVSCSAAPPSSSGRRVGVAKDRRDLPCPRWRIGANATVTVPGIGPINANEVHRHGRPGRAIPRRSPRAELPGSCFRVLSTPNARARNGVVRTFDFRLSHTRTGQNVRPDARCAALNSRRPFGHPPEWPRRRPPVCNVCRASWL